jgi:hypothetical protein
MIRAVEVMDNWSLTYLCGRMFVSAGEYGINSIETVLNLRESPLT